jgi:hypothetical protein
MKTKPRPALNRYVIREIKLPYEVMHVTFAPSMRYRDRQGRDLPEPVEERQTHVHVTIYDDCGKYLWMGKGLTQKMQSGYAVITNEDISLETAIMIAKMDALASLAKNCHGHESIYVCLPKNPRYFINKQEKFTQEETGNKESRAIGKVTVIETRTT